MRDADTIAVVFKGKIIEQGSHDEVRPLCPLCPLRPLRLLRLLRGLAAPPSLLPDRLIDGPLPSLPTPTRPQLMGHQSGSYARLVRHQITGRTGGSSFMARSTTRGASARLSRRQSNVAAAAAAHQQQQQH